jgi:hypothetical protein
MLQADILRIGDIVGLAPKGFEKLVNGLVLPKSNTHHHVLLGPYISDEEDWVIYESLYSGVRVGRLRWYKDQRLKVYRLDEEVGLRAFGRASMYGRRGYDYILPAKLFIFGIKFWLRHGFRPIPYYLLKDLPNSALMCTELFVEAYKPYASIIPSGIAATPSAIEQAMIDGILYLAYDGMLSGLFNLYGLAFKRK